MIPLPLPPATQLTITTYMPVSPPVVNCRQPRVEAQTPAAKSRLTQPPRTKHRFRMKKTKTAKSSTLDPDLKGLPAGLQKQATALQANAKKALTKRATDALERARASVSESARGFYRLGQALVELRAAGMLEVIGYADLYTLAESELSLSRTTVDRLLQAVAHLTQEQYAQLKPTRADALLDLAAATEADDTEAILQGARIALWTKGPVLDVGKASVRELREAAKDVRAHGAPKKARGRSASAEERQAVEQANAALRAKASKAKARVRATKAGQASVFNLVDLTEAELARAMRALAR
jgi:hypothetical protein